MKEELKIYSRNQEATKKKSRGSQLKKIDEEIKKKLKTK